jgi:uncharacterized membrane protein HdeD (DUF308 family)
MTDAEIVEQFQRGRRRANTRGWPAFLVGMLAFYLGGKALDSPATGVVGLIALFGGVGSMIWGIWTITHSMRCPVCGELPMAGNNGILLNPAECPSCGAHFR